MKKRIDRLDKEFVIAGITRRFLQDNFEMDVRHLTNKEMQEVADYIYSHLQFDNAVFLAQGRFGIKEAE